MYIIAITTASMCLGCLVALKMHNNNNDKKCITEMRYVKSGGGFYNRPLNGITDFCVIDP